MIYLLAIFAFCISLIIRWLISKQHVERGNQRQETIPSVSETFDETAELGNSDTHDFTPEADTPEFKTVAAELETLSGNKPKPLGFIKGGLCFAFTATQADTVITQRHDEFIRLGCYVFRCKQGFGIDGLPDLVGVLPTTDRDVVLEAVCTNGANYDIYTPQIITWLRELEQIQPFILTGAGQDYLEGKFTTPVKDPENLAKKVYEFCPDVVDQGTETVEALANELASERKLFLWWD